MFSKLSQGDLERGGVLEVSEIKQHVHGSIGAEPPAPASVVVRYRFPTSMPLPADRPLNVGYSGVFCRWTFEIRPT